MRKHPVRLYGVEDSGSAVTPRKTFAIHPAVSFLKALWSATSISRVIRALRAPCRMKEDRADQ
jgi:uncharacterized protein (DUF1501 family)